MIAINKISCDLKMQRFKMPNAPYSNRQPAFFFLYSNHLIGGIWSGLIVKSLSLKS